MVHKTLKKLDKLFMLIQDTANTNPDFLQKLEAIFEPEVITQVKDVQKNRLKQNKLAVSKAVEQLFLLINAEQSHINHETIQSYLMNLDDEVFSGVCVYCKVARTKKQVIGKRDFYTDKLIEATLQRLQQGSVFI